jgi:hypothetical protein
MWINYRNVVSDEQQDSIQQLVKRFRSGGMAYLMLINKSMGLSQSLSMVPAGGDIMQETQISLKLRVE